MGSKSHDPKTGDGASPGKIFIGGLPKDTSMVTFTKHFGKYGEITDSVIMKDRYTGQPRGFGFITYADPSVVDTVIEETHVINGKQVEIKRTIPKGSVQTKDFKTKKIFVGGIPATVSEDVLPTLLRIKEEMREESNEPELKRQRTDRLQDSVDEMDRVRSKYEDEMRRMQVELDALKIQVQMLRNEREAFMDQIASLQRIIRLHEERSATMSILLSKAVMDDGVRKG